jgi:hypothetical protein
MNSVVRIGNAQAFWGDRSTAAAELLSLQPDLDYLTMDYLAEVSMSILALQRERDASKGYAQDFVEVVRQLADYWSAGGRCRLIVNAGGLQPLQCAIACQKVLEATGCRSLKIGVVQGDDVLHLLKDSHDPEAYRNLDNGHPLSGIQPRLITANVYLGAEGIVEALRQGADIVITGRVADPSMVVAAAIHHFQWNPTDWNALAGATVAGHLLECGTHATGGISTDWLALKNRVNVGFPIAEIANDGTCVITKASTSGGIVSEATIKEQLVYEIGNPAEYISPDCHVSFLNLKVQSVEPNRVAVSGAIGSPPPTRLKVSATYRDGYRSAGTLTIFGPAAVTKARICGEIVLQRLKNAGWTYRDSLVECLGSGDSIPIIPKDLRADSAPETVLRIAVESPEKPACEAFSKEMIPLVTAGPQGTTGYSEGRPNVHPIFRYWPCLVNSSLAKPTIDFISTQATSVSIAEPSRWPRYLPNSNAFTESEPDQPSQNVSVELSSGQTHSLKRLLDIAYGRSGDKGTGANIGILARRPEDYQAMVSWLTAQKVHDYFAPLGVTEVIRYEIPNLYGLNFVLRGILKRIIRNDSQGKALAQALLMLPLDDYSNRST